MNETVLITGASGGIGEVFANELAKSGKNLILVARSKDRLEAIAERLNHKHGVKIIPIALDLSELDSAEALFQRCTADGLQVDLLINNAGFGLFGKFYELEPEKLEEMMLLNMVSLSKITRLFLPLMIDRKKGGVINVASTAAYQPMPFFSTYAATKAYVLSLTEALHVELKGTGVQAMALCPGPTQTEFFKNAGRDAFALAQQPEEVVAAALEGFKNKKSNVVSGIANKMVSTVVGLVPRRFAAETAARMVLRSSK